MTGESPPEAPIVAPPRGSERAVGRAAWEALLVALMVFALYVTLRPDALRTLGTMFDDVVYLSLGKALAAGEGYRSVHLAGAPVHEKFPPGVPALHALLWLIGGTLERTVELVLLCTIGALAAGAGLLWYASRHVLGNGIATSAVLVALPLILLPSVRYYSGASSEPWFILCWAAALVLAHRVGRKGRRPWLVAIALGLTLAAAALVRTQGVVLIPAFMLALTVARVGRREIATVASATLAPLAAWHVWHAHAVALGPRASEPDQMAYTTWVPHASMAEFFEFVRQVLAMNVPGYASTAVQLLVGWDSPKAKLIVVVLGMLTILGLARARRAHPALWASLGAMAGIVLLWPYLQDRFLIALMPFIGLAAAHGLEGILRQRARALRLTVLVALVLAAGYLGRRAGYVAIAAARGAPATDDAVFNPTLQRQNLEIAQWVRANTRLDDRVMTDVGGSVYLRTGRRTVIALPEEPFIGRSVLARPGRYHAERILADSVTHIVAWRRTAPLLVAHLNVLVRHCPGIVEPVPPFPVDTARLVTRYFRIHRDERCLRDFLRQGTRPASAALTQ